MTVGITSNSRVHTVTIANYGKDTISKFFITDFVPNGINILTQNLKLNGEYDTKYSFEKSIPDAVYRDFTAHWWVFGEENENNISLQPNSKITITFQTDAPIKNPFWHFAGWIGDKQEALFGYN